MRVVPLQGEVFVPETENVPRRRSDPHQRERARRARELLARLIEVIQVEMGVAQGVHELARLQIAYLRHHQCEQGVRGDVERHAEEQVGASLVTLAVKIAFW